MTILTTNNSIYKNENIIHVNYISLIPMNIITSDILFEIIQTLNLDDIIQISFLNKNYASYCFENRVKIITLEKYNEIKFYSNTLKLICTCDYKFEINPKHTLIIGCYSLSELILGDFPIYIGEGESSNSILFRHHEHSSNDTQSSILFKTFGEKYVKCDPNHVWFGISYPTDQQFKLILSIIYQMKKSRVN